MRLLVLNQYGEQDASPTARLLREMADWLRKAKHDVEVISAKAEYQTGAKTGASRLWREVSALLDMRKRALAAESPDIVLSFSSPPMLAVVAGSVAKAHRCPHVHWALDLYPDIAEALDVLKNKWLISFLRSWTHRAYRSAAKVVTLDTDMAERIRQSGIEPEIIGPWAPVLELEKLAKPTPDSSNSLPIWLYSGNLGRAHEWKPLAEIQSLLEKRNCSGQLVIQGGGYGLALFKERVEQLGLEHAAFRDYAPDHQLLATLLAARVLVVTMRPAVRGMLWPSKLALSLLTGLQVLFIGPTTSAVAQEVREAGGACFEPDDVEGAADWLSLQLQNPANAASLRDIVKSANVAYEYAMIRWATLLEELLEW